MVPWLGLDGASLDPNKENPMIASLMMYARPELESATRRYWSLIRAHLAEGGIDAPADLSNTAEEFSVWEAPDLVLSQTCGMPFRQRLHGHVTLIGTPDFGLEGCAPGYYRSAIVVRGDDVRDRLEDFRQARFVYNQRISQSGYAAPYAHAQALGGWFETRLQSHGHLNSARMVAQGQGDIAAIDAMTWRLITRYDGFAKDLRVLDWTAPTPGLPYITAKGAQAGAIASAVRSAIAALDKADREMLSLQGLVAIPEADYLAIPNPPAGA